MLLDLSALPWQHRLALQDPETSDISSPSPGETSSVEGSAKHPESGDHPLLTKSKVLKNSPGNLAARRYYQRNKAACKSRSKHYIKSHRAEYNALMRAWRVKNKEYVSQYRKNYIRRNRTKFDLLNETYHATYRARNKVKIRTSIKSWQQRNPDLVRHYRHKRRAKLHGTGFSHDALARTKWLRLNARRVKCYWCGARLTRNTLTVDHIVPVARGGPHCAANLCASCKPCNSSKKASSVKTWRKPGQQMLPL